MKFFLMTDQTTSKRKLKILFLTKWYPNRYDPQLGVFIRKHASSAAKFCDVAVLNIYSDDLANKKYELVSSNEYGVKSVVVYFRKFNSAFSLINKFINLIRYCRSVSIGLVFIRKNFGDHDVTHAYILLRPVLVAFLLKVFRKKPFVISEQWSGFATGEFEKKNWFEKFLTRFIVKRANAVTAVSEFLKNNMLRNGLNVDYNITPNIIESTAPSVASSIDNKIRILVVADLVDEIKNVSGTLKAFAEIFPSNENIVLNIIGDGRDRKKLEALAAELKLLNHSVFFLGRKSNAEVYQHLSGCDFLVMNSNFETFSLICAEAMSCGKPVIATRCGGPQEFVTKETGLLIEPENHQQLVNAMQRMIHEYRNYSSEELKKCVSKKFSSEVVGEKFYNVYATITA